MIFFKKLFRTLSRFGVLFLIILRRSKTTKIFNIYEITVKSESKVFNLASATSNCETVLMGREFFNSPNSREVKDVYFGILNEKNISVEFNRPLGTDLLRGKIPGFIRLEDPRPFFSESEIYAICVCIIAENGNAVGKISAKQIIVKIDQGNVSGFSLFETHQVFEKNWVVFSLGLNKAQLCYSIAPLIFVEASLDLKNNQVQFCPELLPIFAVRNSTHFVSIEGIKIAICHRYIDLGLRYLCVHFFVKIEFSGKIMVSEPFIFSRYSNEYATSLLYSRFNKLQIFFSDHQRGSYIAELEYENLSRLTWR